MIVIFFHRHLLLSSSSFTFINTAPHSTCGLLRQAIGKNLFYFFGSTNKTNIVVVHIHFGMSGRFGTFPTNSAPPLKPTTRLVLQDGNDIIAHLSAMTCESGTLEDYDRWSAKLGPDPLREDADFERLWNTCGLPNCRAGKTSIGAVLMDQKRIAGVGNIYRAEILFKAKVHPETPANELGRAKFELVWYHCIDLMRKGVLQGSILTVDENDKLLPGGSTRRRYVYNQSKCLMCQSKVQSWNMKNRTCYACVTCQPLQSSIDVIQTSDVQVFNSRCAPEIGNDKKKKKRKRTSTSTSTPKSTTRPVKKIKRASKSKKCTKSKMKSAAAAALEKINAGEGRNVEHIALEDEHSLAVIAKSKSKKKKRSSSRRGSAKKPIVID